MATVLKRGKSWTAIYAGVDGKQKWKKGFKDKSETLNMARRMEDECRKIRLGEIDPATEARRMERARAAGDHLDAFKAHMESKARHPNHVSYTIRDIRLCLAHAGVNHAAAFTIPMIDAWRRHCLTTGYPNHRQHKDAAANDTTPKPDSRKTVNRRIASVKAWLGYLVGVGAVERNILAGYEQLNHRGHEVRKRRALTAQETAALLEHCPDPHRKEIYRFALTTGFRRSEVAAMTPACFDFNGQTITISAKDAKTKTHHQTIPMDPSLFLPLKALCAGKLPNVRIFRVPNRTDVVKLLHADLTAAGVDADEVDFHSLRHTFCTLLAGQGVPMTLLRKLARHQDIATTARYYVHIQPADEKAALASLSKLMVG